MGVFAIIFFTLFTALACKRLDWSLLLIIALLPSYLIRFKIFHIPVTFLELMILLAFSVWLLKEIPSLKKRLLKTEPKIAYPFKKEIILLLIISFLSVAVANFSLSALGVWKAYFFEPILFFILLVNVFTLKSDKIKKRIFYSLAFSVFSVACLAIYQKITGHFIVNDFWAAAESRRVVSFFSYPNAVGLFLAPIMSLLLGFVFYLDEKKWKQKISFSFLIIISFLSIIFARSDGAIVAVIISFFAFFFIAEKKKRLTLSLLAIASIAAIFLYSPLRTTITQKLSFQDLSGQIRLQQWKETAQTLKGKNFILGNGLSSYKQAVAPYHQDGIFYNFDGLENFDAVVWASPELRKKYWQPVEIYLYPHNIFLNFWSEIGLLGLVVFMTLMIRALLSAFKLYKHFSLKNSREKYIILGVIVSLFSIFVHGLVDVPYFKNDLSVIFWLLIAMLAIAKVEKSIKEKTI